MNIETERDKSEHIYRELKFILEEKDKFKGDTKLLQKELKKINKKYNKKHKKKIIKIKNRIEWKKEKLKKHFPRIAGENFEFCLNYEKNISFLISNIKTIEELIEDIIKVLDRRYNCITIGNGCMYNSFKNCICKYDTEEDLLANFDFINKKTNKPMYKKIYTVNTENPLQNVLKRKGSDEFSFCNEILICIDDTDEYNILFDYNEDKPFGNELRENNFPLKIIKAMIENKPIRNLI